MTEVQELEQLSNVRAALGLSQRELARLAGVSAMVVSNAENGYSIRRLSAFAILRVLNDKRREQHLPELKIGDVDWVVGK